jgi:hypothetical protein
MVEPIRIMVVVMELSEILDGIIDFNNQLEVLVPKPGKGAIENPEQA